MGWRKVGDEGQELRRLLDLVLDGVEALKTAVRKGQRLDGEGETMFSSKVVWCPELCWSPADLSPNVEDTKFALRRMKDVKGVLVSVSNSLDNAIRTVSNFIAQDCRAAGLSSLPDDVLAHIFEAYHDLDPQYESETAVAPFILASVCKRFRRVAVHLPNLWKNISSDFSELQLSAYTSRCQDLNVHILSMRDVDQVANFLDRIHPYRQWEELHLSYENEDRGHRFFELLGPRVHSPFDGIKFLHICNYGSRSNEEERLWPTSVSLHEVDELTLASWSMPNLSCVKLQNVIPSVFTQCPNVTSCTLILDTEFTEFSTWNLWKLRSLLQSMPRIASLIMGLNGEMSFQNTVVDPLVLPCLMSLEVVLRGPVPSLVIGQLLDLVEAEHLTKLHIHARLPENDRLLADWICAFFSQPASECYRVRSFPAVEDFSLDMWGLSGDELSLSPMFAALPNVQVLSLALPDHLYMDMFEWVEKYGGLRELRLMCINEHAYPIGHSTKYVEFFSKISNLEQWNKFERLEVSSPSGLACEKEELEKYVGDKLVWKV